jgi:hypothetical protein
MTEPAKHVPPTRLCVCGHNHSVHRGPCRVVQGCDCKGFEEQPLVPKPGGFWDGPQNSHTPERRAR